MAEAVEGSEQAVGGYHPITGTHPEDEKRRKRAAQVQAAEDHDKDQPHLRARDIHHRFAPIIRLMTYGEVSVYALVGTALTFMAIVVLYRGVDDIYQILQSNTLALPSSATKIVDALSEFLFVVILMELLATVLTHVRHESFQVKPFVVIGVISGVRQILLVGARLSLNENMSNLEWKHAQIELGINVGIDLVLILCLVMLKHFKVESDRA
ncbi:MAG TPA: phosphate-starvation-inducible PsiE family protein [Acidimicrobiales bacterium]|nr:phosphate-starvation-inducible PsiE family protein [Acidimicrobiales bacterium]